MWPVAALAGTGEFATRFPSALAMAAAALEITAIGRRLVSRRAGLCAGLTFAALPVVSQQGQDARPYAMVTAAAVLASYLFIRAAQDPRPRWFTGYALSLVLVGYLQLFGLLLVVAHVVTLIGLGWRQGRRTSFRPDGQSAMASGSPGQAHRWLVTFAAVGVAVTPLVIISWAQRWSIAWITRPDLQVVIDATKVLTTDSPAPALSVVSVLALAGLGALGVARVAGAADCCRHPAAPPRLAPPQMAPPQMALPRLALPRLALPRLALPRLALPWLLLPPAILLAVSEVMPVYNARYITFCLPAVALLVGSGIATLRQPVRAVALAVVLALAVPGQFALRVPQSGMLVASQFLDAHEESGDGIVYPYGMVQPWSVAYPEGFAPLHDLSLARTGAVAGTLYGRPVSQAVLDHREQGVHRIWIVQQEPAKNPAPYIIPAFHLAHVWTLAGGLKVWLYIRGS
jgi:mannosyltransferase